MSDGKETTKRHPIQPTEIDSAGTLRFKENKIVSKLLEHCSARGLSLNEIALSGFSKDDHDQLMQLIGYSLSAAPISEKLYEIANEMHESDLDEKDAEIKVLREKIEEVKKGVKMSSVALFNVHPDNLD